MSKAGLTLDQITGGQPVNQRPLTLADITQGPPAPAAQQPANPVATSPLLQGFQAKAQAANNVGQIAQLAQPTQQSVNAMIPGAELIGANPSQQSQMLRQLAGAQNQSAAQAQALADATQQAEAVEAQKQAQHPVTGRAENIANAIGQGLVGAKAGLYGLVNPKAANEAEQGEAIEQPATPSLQTTVGKLVGGALPTVSAAAIPGAGPALAAGIMGGQSAGGARNEIAAQRAAGANISPTAEAGYALAQGAVGVGTGLLFGKLGSVLDSLSPLEQSALKAGSQSVIQKAVSLGLKGTKLAGQDALIGGATQAIQNKIAQGYDPNRALSEGLGETMASSAIMGPIMHGLNAVEHPEVAEPNDGVIASMARRRGMATLPGGNGEGEITTPNATNTPKNESVNPTDASGTAPLTLKDVVAGTSPHEQMENAAIQHNPELAPQNPAAAAAPESHVADLASKSVDQMNVNELQSEVNRLRGLRETPNINPMPSEPVETKAARDQAQLEQQRAFEQQQNAGQLAATNPRTLPATSDALSNMADRDVALHEMQTELQQQQNVNEGLSQPPIPSLAEQAEKGQQFENKLGEANETFADKSARPLPPRPMGMMNDLKTAGQKGIAALKTTGAAFSALFPVETRGLFGLVGKNESAENAANALRGGMNRAMNEHLGAVESMSHAEDAFNQLPVELQRDFQGRMYDNLPQATPELRKIADQMYAVTEQRRQQIADLGVDAANDWERNHWNMLWKQDPDQAAVLRDRIYGSGKLGGRAAGTLNNRTDGDFQSKLDAGLVPANDNPLKQFAATDEAQRRFIGMGRAVKSLATDGSIIRTDKLQPGMVDITGVLPKSLADIVPGEEGQGIIAAPKEIADLIRNVATPSWFQATPMRRGLLNFLRTTNNFLTQIALGLSGFHLKKTFGLEQPAMRLAEFGPKDTAEHLGEGLPLSRNGGAENIQSAMMGLKPMLDPIHAKIIDALQNHMTAKPDPFYENRLATHFSEAAKNLSPWELTKSVIKSPFVANQKLTQDVVFKSVQRAKLSFAFDALQKFISGNPEASPQDIHREAGRIVNHVDNIMGLMNRDNLLWNRTARDLASLSMLSVGWNYGTLRSIGSAASELAGGAVRGGKTALNKLAGTNFDAEAPQGSNYRQAKYWLSSAMAAVAYGTIKSYLATGQTPQSTKDVLFPKTGKQDQNGHDVRENPGFYETDLYNWATNPSQTLTDKLSPIMHILGDLGMNKDYQGHEIRNPQDSIGQQIEQVGKYLGTQHLESISVHNIMAKLSRATNPEEMISSVVGGLFNRQAPISVSESPLEKMEQQIEVEKRGAITPEMVDQSKQTGNFVNQFRALTQTDPASGRVTWNGKGGQYQIAHAMAQAGYSQEQIENVAGRALHSGASGIPFDDSLTPADLSRLWTVASPDERQQILPGLQRRISRVKVSAIPKATADAWRALIAQIKQPAIKPQGSE